MHVARLDISGFRNLRQVRIEASPGLNLLIGANAAGKTSLLEALYLLGRGRSFRTRQPRELIQQGAPCFRVVALLHGSAGQRVPVGIERGPRELSARVAGQATRSLAVLARQVPVLLLNPDSHRLLEDGPQQRRRFMDWGLFHAEPGFLDAWRRYDSALRHRNAALRMGAADRVVDAWDGELSAAAAMLDTQRQAFCKALEGALQPLTAATLAQIGVRVEYRRGWPLEPSGDDFASWLRAARGTDRQQAHTRLGPHRADFSLRLDGRTPGMALSRGQQKLLVVALVLAQAALYRQHTGEACILLVDDLPAELDPDNRGRVMRILAAQDAQLFATAIEGGLLDQAPWRMARCFQLADGTAREMV